MTAATRIDVPVALEGNGEEPCLMPIGGGLSVGCPSLPQGADTARPSRAWPATRASALTGAVC